MFEENAMEETPAADQSPGRSSCNDLNALTPPHDADYRLAFTKLPDTGISIDGDVGRFLDIVSGNKRRELQRCLERGERIIEKNDGTYSLPISQIDQPRFKHGSNEGGQGSGAGQGPSGTQPGPAGDQAGTHPREIGVTIDELADFLGDELGLPRIQPKGKQEIDAEGRRYTSVTRNGPNSLKLFKRSFREALLRESAGGTYDPQNPLVVPIRDDMRYRTAKPAPRPVDNAVIIHLMDVSGSMGAEQKEIARTVSFWTDTWIAGHYKRAIQIYVAHDAEAKVVDRDTYYNQAENGGTRISSGYEKVIELLQTAYPPSEWNIYLFQYSDGDNMSAGDSQRCIELLRGELLPYVNLFAYGQVKPSHGTGGDFIKTLREAGLAREEQVVIQNIPAKHDIRRVIREFLRKGR